MNNTGLRLGKRDQARLRAKARMPAAACVCALLLAYAGNCAATLGGAPEQFEADGATVVASATSTSAASNYSTRETTLASGTRVREYLSGGGVVFALAWDGPVLPDLKALLGKYFDQMVAESARMPRVGRSRLGVDLPEVVINSGGHMRAFEGSAWIPAALPAGFTADDVR